MYVLILGYTGNILYIYRGLEGLVGTLNSTTRFLYSSFEYHISEAGIVWEAVYRVIYAVMMTLQCSYKRHQFVSL